MSDTIRHTAQNPRSTYHSFREDKESETKILVLEDLDTGRESYLYQLDSFTLKGINYACLASYEPELKADSVPSLVLMRQENSVDGQTYYESIRDINELDLVFEMFYSRMGSSLGLSKNK